MLYDENEIANTGVRVHIFHWTKITTTSQKCNVSCLEAADITLSNSRLPTVFHQEVSNKGLPGLSEQKTVADITLPRCLGTGSYDE